MMSTKKTHFYVLVVSIVIVHGVDGLIFEIFRCFFYFWNITLFSFSLTSYISLTPPDVNKIMKKPWFFQLGNIA